MFPLNIVFRQHFNEFLSGILSNISIILIKKYKKRWKAEQTTRSLYILSMKTIRFVEFFFFSPTFVFICVYIFVS